LEKAMTKRMETALAGTQSKMDATYALVAKKGLANGRLKSANPQKRVEEPKKHPNRIARPVVYLAPTGAMEDLGGS